MSYQRPHTANSSEFIGNDAPDMNLACEFNEAVCATWKTAVAALVFGLFMPVDQAAAQGYWSITQTSIQDATHPQVDNSGEIVWQSINGGGIFSSVRGTLSSTGIKPALANSGEVVYADWFGGNTLDLVSTTRGRLTIGGVIATNTSSPVQFDVNSSGEVVYTKEVAGFSQIISTVRGQITFDLADHYHPCINDNGEIIWRQYGPLGTRTYSTTRGILPANYGDEPCGLNNFGEVCFSAWLLSSPTTMTTPHIASSSHGVIINDPNVYQYDGGINDAGTIVWDASQTPSVPSSWTIYEAQWVVPEPSVATFVLLGAFMFFKSKRLGQSAPAAKPEACKLRTVSVKDIVISAHRTATENRGGNQPRPTSLHLNPSASC